MALFDDNVALLLVLQLGDSLHQVGLGLGDVLFAALDPDQTALVDVNHHVKFVFQLVDVGAGFADDMLEKFVVHVHLLEGHVLDQLLRDVFDLFLGFFNLKLNGDFKRIYQ